MSRLVSDLIPSLQSKCKQLVAVCRMLRIELIITQTYRTTVEQAALYAMGRTMPGRIVTNSPPGYSWHEFGRAFDIAIKTYDGDKTPLDLYDGPWNMIGSIGEYLGLEWGGRWISPIDRPHMQQRDGMSLAEARALGYTPTLHLT